MIILIIVLILIISIIYTAVSINSEKPICRKLGLDYNKDVIKFYTLRQIDGLNLPPNTKCSFIIFKEGIYILPPNNTFRIDKSKITGAYSITEKEIISKNKDAVGRAIIGGAVFGNVGSVVGAISGSGTKQEKKVKEFMVVTYYASDEQLKALVFAPQDESFTEKTLMSNCISAINKHFATQEASNSKDSGINNKIIDL